jgi:hypothetical protein
MTNAQVLTLKATNANVMRYPVGPTAYSLVGRWIGSMSLTKCRAAIRTTKIAVPMSETVANTSL